MKLNRRDALVALGAAGVTVGAGGAALSISDSETAESGGEGALTDHERRTLVAAAEALYPTTLDGVEAFVTDYVAGRASANAEQAAGMRDAVAFLDDYADAWFDGEFAALDRATRSEAFHRMNADTVDPDPEGGDTAQVRYYVVNELLFALYASPTGGELVGIENPQGHPGGTESYQRGPSA